MLVREVLLLPKITQASATALDYLQEFEGKTLLLKRGPILDTGLGALELEVTWKFPL